MTQIAELTVNRPGWKETESSLNLIHPFRHFYLDASAGRLGDSLIRLITVDSGGDQILVHAKEDWNALPGTPLKTFKGISQTNLDAALDLVEQHYQS